MALTVTETHMSSFDHPLADQVAQLARLGLNRQPPYGYAGMIRLVDRI